MKHKKEYMCVLMHSVVSNLVDSSMCFTHLTALCVLLVRITVIFHNKIIQFWSITKLVSRERARQ